MLMKFIGFQVLNTCKVDVYKRQYLLSSYMDESCVRLLMIVIISMCTCMICILYVTCNKYERILIFGKLYNILRKLGR